MKDHSTKSNAAAKENLEQAATGRHRGPLRDFLAFMRQNKKWWLAPIIVALVLVTVLVILAGTGAAPFLYPLF